MLDLETVSGRSNLQVSHDRCIKKLRFKKGQSIISISNDLSQAGNPGQRG